MRIAESFLVGFSDESSTAHTFTKGDIATFRTGGIIGGGIRAFFLKLDFEYEWALTNFFREVPWELEEAALIDGCTYLGALRKIVLPLAAPGLVTCGILVFISAWNEFLFAYTFVSTDAARTVPVRIFMFQGEFESPWGQISAASTLAREP